MVKLLIKYYPGCKMPTFVLVAILNELFSRYLKVFKVGQPVMTMDEMYSKSIKFIRLTCGTNPC